VVWLRPDGGTGEEPDGDYPFRLITGRVSEHWQSGTMTMQCRQLRRARPDAELEMHPKDAARLGFRPRDAVRVVSRRGAVRLPVKVTDTSPEGTVFAAMHGPEPVGDLFAADPPAGGPGPAGFKTCAVRLEKA
jgi:nitrate reductase NapA